MSDQVPDAAKMMCPFCNAAQRLDYRLEFQCGSQRRAKGVIRSCQCRDNEIAQLKAKVKRMEKAGNAVVEFHSFATVQAWNIAKEDK